MTDEELPTLERPAEPPHPLVADRQAYLQMCEALARGHGPVGIDAERAHGHRYYMWAYLLQFRREGAGTYLLDPIALADGSPPVQLTELASAIGDAEWIVHAATQDLPCLVETGLVPTTLFDTELAARILGWPKVGLSALAERISGLRLLKEHQAADWSMRPLPESWVNYAALDVELLQQFRDVLYEQLVAAKRWSWASQEFNWLATTSTDSKQPHPEPWRRLSHITQVKTQRGLAIARELWRTRDELAARLDKPSTKLVKDAAITELAARSDPTNIRAVEGFRHRMAHRFAPNWQAAIARAQALPQRELPTRRSSGTGLGQPRGWQRRHPGAYARFLAAREVVTTLAAENLLPPEVMISPEAWHRLCWQPPTTITPQSVDAALAESNARPWQRELVAAPLAAALDTPRRTDV